MANGASVVPKERVNIVYRPTSAEDKGDVELPLKILVLGAKHFEPSFGLLKAVTIHIHGLKGRERQGLQTL